MAFKLRKILGVLRLFKRPAKQWLSAPNWAYSPLEPILHPSPWRLRLLGFSALIAQPLFGWIWTSWLPQPYENLWLRCLLGVLGLLLTLKVVTQQLYNVKIQALFSVIIWVEFPFFFSLMYFCNGGSPPWMASLCAVILVYHHLTDWRLASIGTLTAAATAWSLSYLSANSPPQITSTVLATNAVAIAFSWGCALLLGISSANSRRAQLASTLATMGIMAHELRTPLSTAALLGEAMQMEVTRQPANPMSAQIEKLAVRLHSLVRNMNRQIDTQIANAKLQQLPPETELVSAAQLVSDVVANFPYIASRQRHCLQVHIRDEFTFRSSARQFSQVLDNLLKNAFFSLTEADSRYTTGVLRIEVNRSGNWGTIVVEDDGMGIEPALLSHVFKPFFSSNRGTGHGLGLAFCQQVVKSAGGSIQVKSKFAVGATFTITLPLSNGVK